MDDVELSIVVIGRNEAASLRRLFLSVTPLTRRVRAEIIYVDSASDDGSINIASEFVPKIIRLNWSKHLSAAAGRFVGTLAARGRWVLYLDGDMELRPEFIEFITKIIRQAGLNARLCGFIGRYDNVYPDGSVRTNCLHQDQRRRAVRPILGGALLLMRSAVIEAGNWDFSLAAWEETELYTRLRCLGYRLEYTDVPMVRHYTERLSLATKILRLALPCSRRYYGIGHVVRSRILKRSLLSFIRWFPYPFVYWGLLAAAALCFHAGMPFRWFAIGLFSLAVVYVTATSGLKFVVTYLFMLPQAILGAFFYPTGWTPIFIENNSPGDLQARTDMPPESGPSDRTR